MESEEKINHEQFYDLITGEELSWQAILNDLIKTEQLDPWNIDLAILAERYLEVIKKLEEANFFISSKVLHACAFLLRLKSEILNNDYIKRLDESIYGKKEEKKYVLERIELDENELPLLVPRTPIPRFKKITLQELMSALNKAIETETRRIRKDIRSKQAEKNALSTLPREGRVPLRDRIQEILSRITEHIKGMSKEEVTFHELAPSREEKLATFLPILHLDNHEKIFTKQYEPFNEIFIKMEKYQEIDDLEPEEEFIERLSAGKILENNVEYEVNGKDASGESS